MESDLSNKTDISVKKKKHALEMDMTQGNLFKQILMFSLPLVASNLLEIMFNISDIVVVGRFAGATALGSVGSVTQIVGLVVNFMLGMGSAVNVLVAKHYGANQEKDVHKTVEAAFPILLISGLMILLCGQFFSRQLLELISTKTELIDGAELYLRIYLLGAPALAIYDWGNGILGAIGDTKRPLIFLSISGAVNVCLNLLFVIGFSLDVAGVAIASAVSQWLSAIMILIVLLRTKSCYGFNFKEARYYKGLTLPILRLALANGFQLSVFQIANIIIQSAINSFDAVFVEANSAASNGDSIVYTVMAAFYTACSSFIGQNFGGGKKKRMLKSYFISIFYAFAFALVLGSLLALFPRQFLGLFTKDPAVIEAGVIRVRIMAFAYCISAFMDCTISASRGLCRTLVPTIMVILGSCIFRIIWVATIFAHFQTIPSLFLLYPSSWIFTAVLEIIYFIFAFRRETRNFAD